MVRLNRVSLVGRTVVWAAKRWDAPPSRAPDWLLTTDRRAVCRVTSGARPTGVRAQVDVDKPRGKGRDKRPAIGPMLSHAFRWKRARGASSTYSNDVIDDARPTTTWVAARRGRWLRLTGPGDSIAAVEDWIEERGGLCTPRR